MEFVPTLQKKYKEEVVPALMKEFGYKSIMQVPRIEKIVLNQGLGAATADKKMIELAFHTKEAGKAPVLAELFTICAAEIKVVVIFYKFVVGGSRPGYTISCPEGIQPVLEKLFHLRKVLLIRYCA